MMKQEEISEAFGYLAARGYLKFLNKEEFEITDKWFNQFMYVFEQISPQFGTKNFSDKKTCWIALITTSILPNAKEESINIENLTKATMMMKEICNNDKRIIEIQKIVLEGLPGEI